MRLMAPSNRPVQQFLLRYVKLIILAFVAYLVLYFSAFAAMEYQALRKRQEAGVLNAKIYMDTVLNNITQTSYLLKSNTAINKLMYSPMTATSYDYVDAYQEISRQVTQIDLLDSCYVYIIPSETVVASNYGKNDLDSFYDKDFLMEMVSRESPSYTPHIPTGRSAPFGNDYIVQSIRYYTTVRNNAGLVCLNLSRPKLSQGINNFIEPGWEIQVAYGDRPLLGTLPEEQNRSGYFLTEAELDQDGLTVTIAVKKLDFYQDMVASFLRSSLLFIAFALIVGFLLTVLISSFNDTFRSMVLQLAKQYSKEDASEFGLQDLRFYFGKLVDDNQAYAAHIRETAHVVQDKLMMDLLMGKISDGEEFEKLCTYMDIHFPHTDYMAACIDVDGNEEAATPEEALRSKVLIKEVMEQKSDITIYVALECDNTVGVIINFSKPLEQLQEQLKELVEELRCKLGQEDTLNLFVSFSKPVSQKELPAAFAKAQHNINGKYFLKDTCFQFDDTPDLPVGNLVPVKVVQLILSSIDAQAYNTIYVEINSRANEYRNGSGEDLVKFRAELMVLCGVILDRIGIGSGSGQLQVYIAAMGQINLAESIDSLCAAFFSFVGGVHKDVSQRYNSYNFNQYVSKAVEYISVEYNKDISVGAIAEHLSLNVKYFSRLFKEHTGMTVMQFVSDVRMKYAEELLRETSQTVREIGELVGFVDSRSFIRHFKKYYGITPGEYKAQGVDSGYMSETD